VTDGTTGVDMGSADERQPRYVGYGHLEHRGQAFGAMWGVRIKDIH
jgi:hypothetical protein